MALSKGDQAPDFTLKNTEGEEISLSDFTENKNVVVLFFPLAFTGVCTKEMCSTRDNLKVYENLDAEILSISVDSQFTLKEFKKANNLNFNLLSDFNKETAEEYGALYDNFLGLHGVAKRSAFVVGKDGNIKYAEVLEDAGKLPDFNAIQNSLNGKA
ncbi:MAG TPA: peroxiredoxin [Balneolales bacterium]|nr:peroxiredoxin [Balneolales bacterium]